jgi:hypothetical protein
LSRHRVQAIVLKGLPLSVRLYGDPSARATGDLDLFVPESERACAAQALESDLGYRRRSGAAPWEETFERGAGADRLLVDVHSSLVHPELSHLPVGTPASEPASVAEHVLPAHAGPLVPATLAAHLSKHAGLLVPAPLLWFVDFATLWESLGTSQQAAARAAARAAGLAKHLEWAVRVAGAVGGAATRDTAALAVLGCDARGRRVAHPAWRDVAFSGGATDAARALAAWVWPRPVRDDWRLFARQCLHRLTRCWSGIYFRGAVTHHQ